MDTIPHWLENAVLKAEDRPDTVASAFKRIRHAGRRQTSILEELGLSALDMMWLSLCQAPTTESFLEDVRALGARYGVDPVKLGALLLES